jgi:L-fucose dehydrogenase
MDLALKNKIILVTGGAKGIGAAIVRACAEEGAVPVILDRDAEAIEILKSELAQKKMASESILADLTDHATTSRAIESTAKKLAHADGLVNNAGLNDGVSLEKGSPERFTLSLERNLIHYYAVARAVLPLLKRSKGSIVNISSKVAVTGQGGTSGYAASKGAILGLTTAWAAELAPYGVRANTIIPAEVMTPQYADWLKKFEKPEEELKRIAAKVPMGRRMTDVHEIAAMAVFLLSEKSAHINGQHLSVDGGYVHLDRGVT